MDILEVFGVLFLSLLLIVLGIIQIIFYVKIWYMTNDVKKIKMMIPSGNKVRNAQICFMKGDVFGGKNHLDESLYEEILKAHGSNFAISEYVKKFDEIDKRYRKLYTKVGLEMPDIEKYKDRSKLPV